MVTLRQPEENFDRIIAERGYKLNISAGDGGVLVSYLLTSVVLYDSQVAIPLVEMTSRRVSYCYDLMDAAYDAPLIKQHS